MKKIERFGAVCVAIFVSVVLPVLACYHLVKDRL